MKARRRMREGMECYEERNMANSQNRPYLFKKKKGSFKETTTEFSDSEASASGSDSDQQMTDDHSYAKTDDADTQHLDAVHSETGREASVIVADSYSPESTPTATPLLKRKQHVGDTHWSCIASNAEVLAQTTSVNLPSDIPMPAVLMKSDTKNRKVARGSNFSVGRTLPDTVSERDKASASMFSRRRIKVETNVKLRKKISPPGLLAVLTFHLL
ncbi:uncharacterized protein [Ambystoma mexicanum]|uniref:uncharacterized protein n=1 Tax=Ambystoma mexicanum TaxID=8296 RepID=UPI0037E77D73